MGPVDAYTWLRNATFNNNCTQLYSSVNKVIRYTYVYTYMRWEITTRTKGILTIFQILNMNLIKYCRCANKFTNLKIPHWIFTLKWKIIIFDTKMIAFFYVNKANIYFFNGTGHPKNTSVRRYTYYACNYTYVSQSGMLPTCRTYRTHIYFETMQYTEPYLHTDIHIPLLIGI